jgi:hypothetical protein
MLRDELLLRCLCWEEARDLGGDFFDVFPVDDRPDTIRMSIVEARNQHSTPRMVQFSLLLRGPASPVLAQRLYRFAHSRLGEFAFLITPVGRSSESIDYEACFSHAP